ncbi:pyridine nucleotide-disulfide oxidoreductase [Williamsia sp. Leaf354]|uniref:NAD(P)/FAD-dependent oxidoreductase n=1 Tax=Williamsia sp. Leaf354 TaxID=1736349 RepID=UPI0006F6325C|nr:NAD(P)/FAD-dependent oxidoreductase [Williamsia sp. Leaf354]KQS00218.1 pyridine nucleotide-disulfide oxidoreductase [Williamsia sp. Leaf354]
MRTDDATYYDVVIVGSGFGGLAAARRLRGRGKSALLISSTPEYLFQPLLYQVATGVLDRDDIAPRTDTLLRRHRDVVVVEGEVTAVDAMPALLTYRADGRDHRVRYGSLIAATGAAQSYFGRDEYADRTFALKTIDDATRLRAHLRACFDAPAEDTAATTFVVVGAGATGVEVAGQIAELARRHEHREVAITVVEGLDEVLPAFGGGLSDYTRASLEKAGVEVLTGSMVTDIADGVVTIDVHGGAATRKITTDTVVWSAGVAASGFAGVLAEATGCDTDRAGRLLVNDDLTVGGVANIYAIGDMTSLHDYPGQSPVAMQQGRHAVDIITRKLYPGSAFHYLDKGSMSIISRGRAVAKLTERITFRGLLAFGAWLAVHLYYLAGMGNRAKAVVAWIRSFLGTARPGFAEVTRTPQEHRERLAG